MAVPPEGLASRRTDAMSGRSGGDIDKNGFPAFVKCRIIALSTQIVIAKTLSMAIDRGKASMESADIPFPQGAGNRERVPDPPSQRAHLAAAA